jgi:hypothetical protein
VFFLISNNFHGVNVIIFASIVSKMFMNSPL